MPILDDFCRDPGNDSVGWHVMGNQSAGCDNCTCADCDPFQDHRTVPNPDIVANRDISNLGIVSQVRIGVLKRM
ncbi:hypothetical protein D3C81_2031720 [compost metagenome]